jgi:hypothetical protein
MQQLFDPMSILRLIFTLIFIGLGLAMAVISQLLIYTSLWRQYKLGYCKRRLLAIGIAYLGVVILGIPTLLVDVKSFLLGLGIGTVALALILAYFYLFICPPHKRRR